MKDQLNLRVFTTNRSNKIKFGGGKWQNGRSLNITQTRVCIDWVDRPQNDKGLYGTLQLLQCSHLDNFLLKTLKLGWVAFHSLTFQLKRLHFQSSSYKKLAPVLSRFCNGL